MRYIGRIQDDGFLEEEDRIIIYGCGGTGKQVYEELKKRGLSSRLCAFCDGDLKQVGEWIENIPVLSVEDASEKYREAAFLVSSCCVKDMVTTLQKYHVGNIHITRG